MRSNSYKVLIILFVFSCSSPRDSKSLVSSTVHQNEIDFFNEKYNQDYGLVIDESNICDHPFYTYLDCEKEGYFAVHFVPNSKETETFWQREIKADNIWGENPQSNSDQIKQKIWNNISQYIIFCIFFDKKYLDGNGPCSLESTFLKSGSIEYIYYYNMELKEWKLIKTAKTEIPPAYRSDSFFRVEFPKLCTYDAHISEKELIIERESSWALNCNSNNTLDLNTNSALPLSQLLFVDNFSMNANITKTSHNIYSIFFDMFTPLIPVTDSLLYFQDLSKDSLVAEFSLLNTNQGLFNWKGFYNQKLRRRVYLANPFDPTQNPVPIYICK